MSKRYKGPINGPCSACGDGDTAMKFHDHDDARPNAYQDAVTAINFIASNHVQPETARQELEALKALIELLLSKLPTQEVDYETERSEGS